MARYGRFRYSAEKYGFVADPTVHPLWVLQVNWTGEYTGDNELFYATELSVRRGRQNYINPGGSGFESVAEGVAHVVLDNADGRYDPLNTNSPLYPHVMPGKFARLWFYEPNGGTPYQVMRGIISDIKPISGPRAEVRVQIVDGLRWLRDRIATCSIVAPCKYTTFISSVLLAAGWPQNEWGITASAGGQTASYLWAWRENAMSLIQELITAEVGLFFQNRSGYAISRARDYNPASVATLTEDILLDKPVVHYSWETVRNNIQIYVYNRGYLGGDAELWNLNNPEESIEAGETKYLWVEFEFDGDRNIGANHTFGLNLEVNTQSDGLGADLTAQCSIGASYNGGGCRLQIINGSASKGYFITLSVDAAPEGVLVTNPPTIVERSDEYSQATYGQRTLTLDSVWQDSVASAEAIATGLLAELKSPVSLPMVQLEDRLVTQYGLDVFDRVTLQLPSVGVDGDYRIGAIEHMWTGPSGDQSVTTLTCEPYFTLDIT